MPPFRRVSAIIQAELGKKGTRQWPVTSISAYTVDTAMDTDTDPFSIDLRLKIEDMSVLLQRDTEVRVNLFTQVEKLARIEALHSGIADQITFDSDDRLLSITGRDFSCLATDTDAAPGKWKHVRPKAFITQRAQALGISNIAIAPCSELALVVTDASEKEWALWYRIMREKKMWLWLEPSGRLVGDKLNYAVASTYFFGRPAATGPRNGWIPIERIEVTKSDQGRLGEVWVYGENPKTKKTFFGRGMDTTIRAWKRKPVKILTSTTAKNAAAVKKEADDEIFESIVGSTEVVITIRDPGLVIRQNRMATLNIPELSFSGMWFVVGVRLRGGADGFFQEVRLREKGFALSKRVPEAPKLVNPTNDNQVPSTIAAALAQSGEDHAAAFSRAAAEFAGGWDYATYLGVLMAIADKETGNKNIRQTHAGAYNGIEWFPMPTAASRASVDLPADPITGNKLQGMTLPEVQEEWRKAFGNEPGNPHNPFGNAEAGVGVMQLTSQTYKDWADAYGWNGAAKVGEYDGGRWNPESNIRAAARALQEKLKAVHADPNNPDDIWRGVEAYNGSGSAAVAYAADVRNRFKSQFGPAAAGAVSSAVSLPEGTKVDITVAGHTFKFPQAMPATIAKAINFAFRHLGDPYRWDGPAHQNDKLANGRLLYDCSSFVTAALYAGGLRQTPKTIVTYPSALDQPYLGHHGESTYTLWDKGVPVTKDNLLPGDLVFFENGPDHVGMYLDDGLIIHDPHTGDVVKIAALNSDWFRQTYKGARRFVDWPYVPSPGGGGT